MANIGFCEVIGQQRYTCAIQIEQAALALHQRYFDASAMRMQFVPLVSVPTWRISRSGAVKFPALPKGHFRMRA
jgi:hypothetical protein